MPNKTHALRQPTARDNSRLKAMNKQLYPAILKTLPSGAIQFNYRKNGKVIRIVVGHDLESAYERAILMRKEVDMLPVVSQRKITLAQWYDEWSSKRFPELSPNTSEGYRYYWQALPDDFKEIPLDKLTRENITSALARVDKPSMRGHAGGLLSSVLNAAVRGGYVAISPWKFTDKRKKKIVRVLSSDELNKVFECASASARPGLALAGFCGLRREEIMGLKVEDVDLNKRLIYVRRAKIKIYGKRGKEYVKGTKTGEPRVVPIPDQALTLIEPAVIGKQPSDFLYPTFRGELHIRLHTACRTAGLPHLSLHELRHICGSNLMMTGGVALAQAVLGHKDISTTVDTYGHLNSSYLIAQVNKAHFSDEKIQKFAEKAVEFAGHSDPEVRDFATEVLQICQYLSTGRKNACQK